MQSSKKIAFFCACAGALMGISGVGAGLYFGVIRPMLLHGRAVPPATLLLVAGVLLLGVIGAVWTLSKLHAALLGPAAASAQTGEADWS
ncbi:hypothetical protein RugamoR64_55680 [Duganella rhizosphaerae]|uniref:hypothetical protein n=1 Tax=Duganella rhizosphaerae TaxID=2885763 RepID=UPI0030EAE06E